MKRFIFHIGPHKTATTFLQVSMMRTLEKVDLSDYSGFKDEKHNFFYLSATSDQVRYAKKSVSGALLGESPLNEGADNLARVIQAISVKYHRIALINENFIGPQVGQYDHGASLYGLHDHNPLPTFLTHLKEALARYDIEMVIAASFRRQDTFINSTYLNLVADGYSQPFSQYYDTIQDINLDWHEFMGKLTESHKLCVFPFELVIEDQSEFLRHFADICGYLGEIRPAEEKRESLSKVGLKLALKINRLDLPGVARNKIIRLLKADLPKNKYGKATFKQKLDRQFYLKYDHSNRRVFEEYVSEDYRYIYDKYYAPND